MARNLIDIQQQIISQLAAKGIVVSADDSVTSRRRNWVHVIAYCIWFLETLFDIFKADVTTKIRQEKAHRLRWYVTKGLAYQHGFNLLPDPNPDEYDNAGHTEAEIQASKIVKYAAANEQANQFQRLFIRIKLATSSGSDLTPLDTNQIAGVRAYFARIKDAGVPLLIESLPADNIKQKWTIYYDPSLLDTNGNMLDGSASNIVREAIKQYLKNLPFNGEYVLAFHTDAVQKIQGVTIPVINECYTKYGLLDFESVHDSVIPDAGYLRFATDEDLEIIYIPKAPIQDAV